MAAAASDEDLAAAASLDDAASAASDEDFAAAASDEDLAAASLDDLDAATLAFDSDFAVSVTLFVDVVVFVDEATGSSVFVVLSAGLFSSCRYLYTGTKDNTITINTKIPTTILTRFDLRRFCVLEYCLVVSSLKDASHGCCLSFFSVMIGGSPYYLFLLSLIIH